MDATERLIARARELDLPYVGIAVAGPAPHAETYTQWIAAGRHADMHYLARDLAVRADPCRRFPWLRRIVSVAVPYAAGGPSGTGATLAPQALTIDNLISRYAQGRDYHRVLERRLRALAAFCRDDLGAQHARYYVDAGPVLEREWAVASGLGFIGGNSTLIRPGVGSWLFLGELLLDLPLSPTTPPNQRSCAGCRRCIEACPTGAIVSPGVVDARRCLSYWSIENRGVIPLELRAPMGWRLFGCDTCQAVCPHNRAPSTRVVIDDLRPRAAYGQVHVRELIDLSPQRYDALFRGSTIRRAGRVGLRRNAMIVCANCRVHAADDALLRALDDPEPVLRATAVWALRRMGRAEAARRRLRSESDPLVLREMTG